MSAGLNCIRSTTCGCTPQACLVARSLDFPGSVQAGPKLRKPAPTNSYTRPDTNVVEFLNHVCADKPGATYHYVWE